MKKVLVVSDSFELISHIKSVAQKISAVSFEYKYSFNNHEFTEFEKNDIYSIDVNAQSDYIVQNFELVISAHCKQIFPDSVVNKIICINIHPGFNPYNRGWYPQVFSIIDKQQAGCTIHMMDEKIDHGCILYQRKVPIESWETSFDVYRKIVSQEKKLITENLNNIITNNFTPVKSSLTGNYNSKDDFKSLTKLNLKNTASLGEHIDLLRALTHKGFRNAYFYDEKGNKVFLKLHLEVEN